MIKDAFGFICQKKSKKGKKQIKKLCDLKSQLAALMRTELLNLRVLGVTILKQKSKTLLKSLPNSHVYWNTLYN